jgi:hypothetical protein
MATSKPKSTVKTIRKRLEHVARYREGWSDGEGHSEVLERRSPQGGSMRMGWTAQIGGKQTREF